MDARDPIAPQKYKRLKRIEGMNDARALNWSCFRNQPFLESDRFRGWVVEAIAAARDKHEFQLWAWCIMPTHMHLMIYPGSPEDASLVSDILKQIKLPLAQRVIAWAKREDPSMLDRMRDEQPNGSASFRFWQRGGGFDRNLSTQKAIWDMIHYIHRNPVEDGLCASPEDWEWSSARTYLNKNAGMLPIDYEHIPGAMA